MKIIVVGLGVQGKKRSLFLKDYCHATVDPFKDEAKYKNLSDVPLKSFDAAFVCTPEEQKIPLIEYLLAAKKHVLVEKPLLAADNVILKKLKNIAEEQNVCCYTAYNHRFEPHFVKVKEHLGSLGKIYTCRLFYGNGTARDVRNSVWRDKEMGVLTDLGSHLLDALYYWFEREDFNFQISLSNTFENQSYDHVVLTSKGKMLVTLEMSLLSWKNQFTCDIIGEEGSLHIDSLCKWGPATYIKRKRKLPSGRPSEEAITLIQEDTTWQREHEYFFELCKKKKNTLENDMKINAIFNNLSTPV